jgi:UDP-2,4-diacetamido-2,4,6-trideoxy-beta-L-altropyranose hydrolase
VSDSLLLIRADANAEIGVGHIMRCLGLAQHWQAQGGRVIFIMAQANPAIELRLQQEKFETHILNSHAGELEDAHRTAQILRTTGAKILLADGYHFKQKWFTALRHEPVKLALWTDYLQDMFLTVDLVLNQNPHAQTDEYQEMAPGAKVYTGLNYLVLRTEFLKNQELRRCRNQGVGKLLITLGGSDSANDSAKILSALKAIRGSLPPISLVVGHNNPRFAELTLEAKALPTLKVEKPQNNFAQYAQGFDLAITAAGATVWELGFLGIPTLAYVVAENQVPLASAIESLGMGVNMGWNYNFNADRFTETLERLIGNSHQLEVLSRKALATIDGQGGTRVVEALKNLIK